VLVPAPAAPRSFAAPTNARFAAGPATSTASMQLQWGDSDEED
jgi:hypothetical protein